MQGYTYSSNLPDGPAVSETQRPYFKPLARELVTRDYAIPSTNTDTPTLHPESQCSTSDMSHSLYQYSRQGFSAPASHFAQASQYGFPQHYGSQANSTLSPSGLMTPSTNELHEYGTGSRRSSNSGTPSVTTLISPRSPRDCDFPTGNYLPLQYQSCGSTWLHTDSSPEGFPLHGGSSAHYLNNEVPTLDAYSPCNAIVGPPYPTHISDENVDYHSDCFDPRTLQPEGHFQAEHLNYPDYDVELVDHISPDIYNDVRAPNNDGESERRSSLCIVDPALPGSYEMKLRTIPLTTASKTPESRAAPAKHQASTPRQSVNRRRKIQGRQVDKNTNQCSNCRKVFDTPTRLKKHVRKEHTRPYPCIFESYGCTSVFGTKNEWFRHIKVQHLRLETWKCDIGECARSNASQVQSATNHNNSPTADPNLLTSASKGRSEYDRKDLFLNHVRRCHKDAYLAHSPSPPSSPSSSTPNHQQHPCDPTTAFENAVQKRCHITLRTTPQITHCPCCPTKLWKDFDLRCEHIGRAMEQDAQMRVGFYDPLLEEYMVDEGLLQRRRDGSGGWLLTGAEGKKGGRQARRGGGGRGDEADDGDGDEDEDGEGELEEMVTPRRQQQQQQQGSRKSKRNELKRAQRRRQVGRRGGEEEEEEEEDDDAYGGDGGY